MSKLLEVTNNTSSRVVLECTKTHIIRVGLRCGSITYRKGERHVRNTIHLDISKWKIAAAKYQYNYERPKSFYVKKNCSL